MQVLEINENYNKVIYLVLSIAYKRINDTKNALSLVIIK